MYLTSTADVEKIVPEIDAMPIIGVDTETTGLDPFESDLLLVQVGDLDKQYVIDARECSLEPLRPILESRKVKVLHNAKFDYKMLKAQAGIRMENVVDTMLIEQVLRNGRRAEGGNGLAAVVERYTHKKISKAEQESFINHTGDFTKDQLEYARRDVIYPIEVLHKQMPMVVKAGLEHTIKLECLAVTAIADIELNGVMIDQERWMKIAQQAQTEATKLHEKLDEQFEAYIEQRGELLLFEASRRINYDSDKQLREALLYLGIELESTSKAVLSSLDPKEYPVAQLILDYRQQQKIVSTYGATFLEHVHRKTGRIHCDFRQLGAESGRMSSTSPNLQNIPSDSEFRSCFIAGEGRKVITADYSGCELRILADLSQDPEFLRAFRNDEDLHSLVATMMFKVPVSKDENKELRQAAKAINFGLAYGMSSKGLAAQIGCPDEEAEDLLQKYFEGFPKIASYLEQAGRLAVSRGYSTTIGGRRRWFDMSDIDTDRRKKGSIERKGKNSPIQGTNADMIKLALYLLRDELHNAGVDAALVNTVHDEVVVECEESIVLEVQEMVEKVMRAAGEYYVKAVPVDVESAIADCWSK